jgi:hypothetical protein
MDEEDKLVARLDCLDLAVGFYRNSAVRPTDVVGAAHIFYEWAVTGELPKPQDDKPAGTAAV